MTQNNPNSALPSSALGSYYNWPWPLGFDQNKHEIAKTYRGSLDIFLGSDFLPESEIVLTDPALKIFNDFLEPLLAEPRWANYKSNDIGDMDVANHTLRQTQIVAQSLITDRSYLDLNFQEVDIMMASAVTHDFGEAIGKAKVGDISYDLKSSNKTEMEVNETKAVFEALDTIKDIDPMVREQLKEVYLRVTTSLDEETSNQILNHPSTFPENTKWDRMNDAFNMYERYSYLMTAFQQFPFEIDSMQLSFEEENILKTWNRTELENAMKNGQEFPSYIKQFILYKNVLLNQWKIIQSCQTDGAPSSIELFNNPIVSRAMDISSRFFEPIQN